MHDVGLEREARAAQAVPELVAERTVGPTEVDVAGEPATMARRRRSRGERDDVDPLAGSAAISPST